MKRARLVQRWYSQNRGLKADVSAGFPRDFGTAVPLERGTQRTAQRQTSSSVKR